jgi:hypothetical protein
MATRPEDPALIRLGGRSAIALGLAYILITVLYAITGQVPSGVEASLQHFAANAAAWWAIAGLSVLTDVLFLPLAAALYLELKPADRMLALVGSTLLVLFAILDLAVTWPSYAALISLGDQYAATTDGALRATYLAAATYPSTVLASTLWAVYAILVPALGILALGVAMLRTSFGRALAWLGVITGVLGIVAVAGPLVVRPLGLLAIATSVLTIVWVLVAGYRLIRLGEAPIGADGID